MDPQLLAVGLVVVAVLGGLAFSFLRPHDAFVVRVHKWKEIQGVPDDQAFNHSSRTVKLDVLADLYLDADAQTREQIRQLFDSGDQYELLHRLISRAASLIRSGKDVVWLRRGLAIAAIENGRFDRQDTIKRLIQLRQSAERAGMDVSSYFAEMNDKLTTASATVINKVASFSVEDMKSIVGSANRWRSISNRNVR